MITDGKTSTYGPPALRVLGSVHGLTRGALTGGSSDGVLLKVSLVVNASV